MTSSHIARRNEPPERGPREHRFTNGPAPYCLTCGAYDGTEDAEYSCHGKPIGVEPERP